jgi:hypothetical protein
MVQGTGLLLQTGKPSEYSTHTGENPRQSKYTAPQAVRLGHQPKSQAMYCILGPLGREQAPGPGTYSHWWLSCTFLCSVPKGSMAGTPLLKQ